MAPIRSDMKVSYVVRTWPAAADVFRRRGCPEMRSGFFGMMARIMSIRAAARVHRLVLPDLLVELNRVAEAK